MSSTVETARQRRLRPRELLAKSVARSVAHEAQTAWLSRTTQVPKAVDRHRRFEGSNPSPSA